MSTTSYAERVLSSKPTPDFGQLLTVLRHRHPERPTLFEFFLNGPLYELLAKIPLNVTGDPLQPFRCKIRGFRQAGYDYVTHMPPQFGFPRVTVEHAQTISLNEGVVIKNREDFEKCPWVEPDNCDYSELASMAKELPDGMKVVSYGPGGILENVVRMIGYDNLCFMLVDQPDLAQEIFTAVGSRLVRHYEIVSSFDSVGACICNDDWGFKTQPMLSPPDLRKYVFPWHQKMVAAIHAAGKPTILHSCGNASEIMGDIIHEMAFDGKHSFEDAIEPVEEAYDRYGSQIAILGGLDVDFTCRSEPDRIYRRARAMLERSAEAGSYALGTGNSVPTYVPHESYFAMIWAALETRQ